MPPLLPVPAICKGTGHSLGMDSDCILRCSPSLFSVCRASPWPCCTQTVVSGFAVCSREPLAGSVPALSFVDKVSGHKGRWTWGSEFPFSTYKVGLLHGFPPLLHAFRAPGHLFPYNWQVRKPGAGVDGWRGWVARLTVQEGIPQLLATPPKEPSRWCPASSFSSPTPAARTSSPIHLCRSSWSWAPGAWLRLMCDFELPTPGLLLPVDSSLD